MPRPGQAWAQETLVMGNGHGARSGGWDEEGWSALAPDAGTWEVAARAISWTPSPVQRFGRLRLTYTTAIVDPEGRVRSALATQGQPAGAAAIARALRKAVHHRPPGVAPTRPGTLRVEEASLARSLESVLGPLGVTVHAGPAPQAGRALDQAEADAERLVGRRFHVWAPAWWIHQSPTGIVDYFRVSQAFLALQPWNRGAPEGLWPVRWTDGRAAYALLLRPEGSTPERGGAGVALFAQLRDYETVAQTPVGRDARSQRASNRLMATLGGIEAVSFQRVTSLHPRDAHHLLRQGHTLEEARTAYLPNNVGVHGPIGLPRPLRDYVDILEALTAALRTSVSTPAPQDPATTGAHGQVADGAGFQPVRANAEPGN